ncbi:MAG: CaiB/BaiF CoA-transferase family protein [Porticoccaceae bacterium]
MASRGKRSIAMDLKKPEAIATCLKLIEKADAIVEGFRPGVMERLGLGPDVALEHNPRLVYTRMTGWGQEGSIAHSAGHDINYIALSYELYASGVWSLERNANSLDGAAPNYDTYQCADGKWISIASTGAPFYRQLREIAGFDDPEFDHQKDKNHWASLKAKVAEKFRTKTQREWCALMEGTDVCFAPVFDMSEAPAHHHNKSRNTFIDIEGVTQPAPTPRYSATPGAVRSPPPEIGQHTGSALKDWGIDEAEVAALESAGAI